MEIGDRIMLRGPNLVSHESRESNVGRPARRQRRKDLGAQLLPLVNPLHAVTDVAMSQPVIFPTPACAAYPRSLIRGALYSQNTIVAAFLMEKDDLSIP